MLWNFKNNLVIIKGKDFLVVLNIYFDSLLILDMAVCLGCFQGINRQNIKLSQNQARKANMV